LNNLRARRTSAEFRADPARVLAHLFLPGEEPHLAHSRAHEVVARVMALDEAEVDRQVTALLEEFSPRHPAYEQLLVGHAAVVASHVDGGPPLSRARTLLLGATLTAEYAVEGAAVCNPSAVLHPDQGGLDPGQARVAVSVRGIGEGHVSSIGFRAAIVGPGERWTWTATGQAVSAGAASIAPWRRAHLRAVLAAQSDVDEVAHGVLRALPVRFTETEFERVLSQVNPRLSTRAGTAGTLERLRRLVGSTHVIEFDRSTTLTERVIMPAAAEESNGMEDARFTRFVGADGAVDYRTTYTAYDGRRIAPRLLTSPDLRVFQTHWLAGSAARNKGMAVFPRLVRGRHLALCRSDGENLSLASSVDGFGWTVQHVVHAPASAWETLQVGNCGPPIETASGWLVLTHGVGAMRAYSIGAILLDLDDPSVVVGALRHPLLEPGAGERDGYVANVVYSCGGLIHDGRLWLPYGIGDARVGVAHVLVGELLAELGGG